MQPLSLKGNILSSYASQLYMAVIGIVMVPTYVTYLGAEAYGLVGFFAMLQAWFQLLDVGLTPTMSRETARYRGGATDALNLRRLLRSLEGLFAGIALVGAALIIGEADNIARHWLNVQHLAHDDVRRSIALMAYIIALRWLSSLYRGTITGFERLVWLNAFNSAVATARFVLVLPLIMFVTASPVDFFVYQLMIAGIELTGLMVMTYHLLPKVDGRGRIPWEWQPLRGVLKFSLSVAFLGSVWVLITQTDKLILSKLLSLSDYAYFTLAVLVASGILLISSPVSVALLPRLSKLNAEHDEIKLIRLYRNATQLVGVVAIPATLILAFFPTQVLWAWTGDLAAANKAAPVLRLYALGNGMLVFAAFPYYLQFAKGDLRLHLIGNALFVVVFIPLLFWAVNRYGMVGAGYAWIGANLFPFLFWLPVVHRKFVKGLHRQWLATDVIPIALLPITLSFGALKLLAWPTSRVQTTLQLCIVALALGVSSVVGSSWVRKNIVSRWPLGKRQP